MECLSLLAESSQKLEMKSLNVARARRGIHCHMCARSFLKFKLFKINKRAGILYLEEEEKEKEAKHSLQSTQYKMILKTINILLLFSRARPALIQSLFFFFSLKNSNIYISSVVCTFRAKIRDGMSSSQRQSIIHQAFYYTVKNILRISWN